MSCGNCKQPLIAIKAYASPFSIRFRFVVYQHTQTNCIRLRLITNALPTLNLLVYVHFARAFCNCMIRHLFSIHTPYTLAYTNDFCFEIQLNYCFVIWNSQSFFHRFVQCHKSNNHYAPHFIRWFFIRSFSLSHFK